MYNIRQSKADPCSRDGFGTNTILWLRWVWTTQTWMDTGDSHAGGMGKGGIEAGHGVAIWKLREPVPGTWGASRRFLEIFPTFIWSGNSCPKLNVNDPGTLTEPSRELSGTSEPAREPWEAPSRFQESHPEPWEAPSRLQEPSPELC